MRLERLRAPSPGAVRIRVWANEHELDAQSVVAVIDSIAPGAPARLVNGSSRRRESGEWIERDQILGVLEHHGAENLQLYWDNPDGTVGLELICELYDDHLEVVASAQFAERLEAFAAQVESGAA